MSELDLDGVISEQNEIADERERGLISVEVNGFDVLVTARAHRILSSKMVKQGLRMKVCRYSSDLVPNWGCTREAGHEGPHIAHGLGDNLKPDAYAVFANGERSKHE